MLHKSFRADLGVIKSCSFSLSKPKCPLTHIYAHKCYLSIIQINLLCALVVFFLLLKQRDVSDRVHNNCFQTINKTPITTIFVFPSYALKNRICLSWLKIYGLLLMDLSHITTWFLFSPAISQSPFFRITSFSDRCTLWTTSSLAI